MPDVQLEQLGKAISESASVDEDRASRFMSAFVEVIREELGSGKEINLSGLGTLTLAGSDGKPLAGMYGANLVGDIAAKLNETNDSNIESMVNGLVDGIRKEILDGRKVILNSLGSFEVRNEKPEIERQAKGHRLIKPAMTVFRFNSTETFNTPAGEGKLIFTPAGDFKKKIEQFRESAIMLVVPERDFFVKTLEYYFDTAGWDTEVFENVEEAMAELGKGKAYLVVVDAGMNEYQKFVQRLKMDIRLTNVPLILLFPSEDSLNKLDDVSIMGDENLPQPFEFRKLLDSADAEILRAAEEQLIFDQQLSIHIPTDEQMIEKVIDDGHKLFEASGMTEEAQVAISAAYREAVVNAAQHGNKYKKDRKIEIQYLLDKEKVTIVVKDNGEGFNHEQYVKQGQTGTAIAAARERHTQGRMGGLGILLMLRCCDRLEYNQKGNQITLTKLLKGSA